jgi:hypothetical protein
VWYKEEHFSYVDLPNRECPLFVPDQTNGLRGGVDARAHREEIPPVDSVTQITTFKVADRI